MKTITLTRTATALAEYDKADAAVLDCTTDEQLDGALARFDDARAELGEAFYLDTKDRNDRETVANPDDALVGFMRRMALEGGRA